MVDVMLADMAIEVCDGTASMVDADVDYWVYTVGQYCPLGYSGGRGHALCAEALDRVLTRPFPAT